MAVYLEDKTIERNYQQKWQFLVDEYLLIKQKKHPRYRFVKEFYEAHGICKQSFCKYFARYKNSGDIKDLLPQKSGPRWQAKRPDACVEAKVLQQRSMGLNKYEIHDVLKKELHAKTPSPSGIYNVLKRNGVNRLRAKEKEAKKLIVKEKAGELGHIDCHYLNMGLLTSEKKRRFLVCIVDDFSRIAWAEVVEDIKSLTVMFSALRIMNLINHRYSIQFDRILSDNGKEFSSHSKKSKEPHPFERMLTELGIKHSYTRPYRPQTNGKVERFWRTLNEELIEGATFDSLEEFKNELEKYLLYYNELRPHQGIKGLKPKEKLDEYLSTK